MDDVLLSPREQRILAEMEEMLRRGETPDRRPRSPRPRPGGVRGLLLPAGVAVAFTASAVLMGLATTTGRPAFVWAFAGAWTTTLAGLTALVVRWCRRWAASRPDA
ncbi:hypothetical protein [Streptomyces roseoviridis]|uniref:hypothetical protein n=1 Tax=Streptomyces roseoviridis TaxID=67361 RepID=UPI0031E63909